ncbi:MAG: hypothetical protein DME29_01335 [Verrucomicrobia bacterium]|nr:MAG: hypothetical protein DME29_01335 [Verrucomicrobiota bacterium]
MCEEPAAAAGIVDRKSFPFIFRGKLWRTSSVKNPVCISATWRLRRFNGGKDACPCSLPFTNRNLTNNKPGASDY